MVHVLVVDDSLEICQTVKATLQSSSVNCLTALSSAEGLKLAQRLEISLFVLDMLLPDGDGLSLMNSIRQIKKYKNTPIIFLSSVEDLAFKVSAFSLGADDYIVKPFNTLEFKSRVDAKLKKISEQSVECDTFSAGSLHLDQSKNQIYLEGQPGPISLTPIEFRILALLARREEVIFSRDQILDAVWGHDTIVNDRTVDSHIYSLRKKLGSYSGALQAVPNMGYRFRRADRSDAVV
jgi:DNA-binding response OmpR family regulator